MTTTALRKELHSFIDTIPEQRLPALRPLLADMADRDWLVIETDLTDEEIALCEAGIKDYKEHPETFITLDEFIAEEQTKKKAVAK
jgi:hypothetical protein